MIWHKQYKTCTCTAYHAFVHPFTYGLPGPCLSSGSLVAGFSWRSPGFVPRSVRVGFVVDKVTLKRVFPEFFNLSLSISFHRLSPYSYIIWGMSNMSVRAAVQRRSLTPSKSTQAVDSFLGYLTRSCYSYYSMLCGTVRLLSVMNWNCLGSGLGITKNAKMPVIMIACRWAEEWTRTSVYEARELIKQLRRTVLRS
jgi:hypothetical protein